MYLHVRRYVSGKRFLSSVKSSPSEKRFISSAWKKQSASCCICKPLRFADNRSSTQTPICSSHLGRLRICSSTLWLLSLPCKWLDNPSAFYSPKSIDSILCTQPSSHLGLLVITIMSYRIWDLICVYRILWNVLRGVLRDVGRNQSP